MGDDADQGSGEPGDRAVEDASGPVDVRRLVRDELASIKGMAPPAVVKQGPRPRSLDQARIQVKSEPHVPRVRSSKLQARRHVRTSPSPPPKLNTPDTDASTEESAASPRDVPKTSPMLPDLVEDPTDVAPTRRRLLEPMQVATGLLLLETALMPSLRANHVVAPWSAWTDPASPNFVALSFIALLGLLSALPLSRLFRIALHGLSAALLVVFSIVLLRSALSAGLFDGQPALHALFVEGMTGGLMVILTVCVVSTALFWLQTVPESRRARWSLLAGVSMTLFAYGGLTLVTSLGGSPLSLLFAATSESLFLGDRMAASLAILPLLAVLAATLVWLPGDRGGLIGPLGVVVWLLSVAPLMVLAMYVAPAENWQDVLVPIQISSLLAAGLLLLPACLAHVFAVHEVGDF